MKAHKNSEVTLKMTEQEAELLMNYLNYGPPWDNLAGTFAGKVFGALGACGVTERYEEKP